MKGCAIPSTRMAGCGGISLDRVLSICGKLTNCLSNIAKKCANLFSLLLPYDVRYGQGVSVLT